jgi:Tol biopolymer transport system component
VASVTGVVGGGFDNPLPGSQPFLSADGSSLAYADGTNIYVTDLNGKANHTIAGAQGFLGFLAWSPDGKQLVFTSTTGTDTQLLTVSPGGGTPTPMLSSFDPMGHTSFEAYSPDGGQMLLSGSGDQTDDIRIVNADGTGLYTVTGAGEGSDAVWLP